MAATVEIDESNGAVLGTNGVIAVSVTAGGSGYTSAPTVGFTGGAGTGATAVAIISGGAVIAVVMTAEGSGYTSAPTVSFTGGGGTGATATASIADGTRTHNITNTNMGSTDAVNLDPVANPITPANRSYIKYQRIHITAMGGSSKIDNLKVWRTGALGTGGVHTHVTNARTATYGGHLIYAAPVATAVTGVDQTMPTTAPGSANLGIGGSLSGSLAAAGYSDFLGHQITTDASATAGSTSTMNYQYDETA